MNVNQQEKHRDAAAAEFRELLATRSEPKVLEALANRRSEDVAALLGMVDDEEVEQVFELLNRTDSDRAAEVLALLDRHDVARLFASRTDKHVADVLDHLSSDDAIWAVELLPESRVDAVVAAMHEEESREVRERLEYPEDSAGRFMSEEYLALPPEASAGEAIARLQTAGEEVTIVYIYLVDAAGHLTGVVSLRKLLRVAPETPLASLSLDPISAHVLEDQEEVARRFAQNDFVCLPVVDGDDKLVGVITHDDVMDVLREEATEDMLQMAGTSPEEVIAQSAWRSARIRMPWLLFSLFGGLLATKMLDLQEKKLGELFVALALFVPVIVGMGGNLGTQAATIVVRGLATGRVRMHDAWPVFGRELRTAAIVGITYGTLLMVAGAVLLQRSLLFSLVIGVSLAVSMIFAAAIGTLLPLGFVRMGVDPAVATGPLVTTSMDVLGIATYMTIAGWLLS